MENEANCHHRWSPRGAGCFSLGCWVPPPPRASGNEPYHAVATPRSGLARRSGPGRAQGTWPDLTEATRGADSVGREIWTEKVDGFDMRLLVTESTPVTRFVTQIQSPP